MCQTGTSCTLCTQVPGTSTWSYVHAIVEEAGKTYIKLEREEHLYNRVIGERKIPGTHTHTHTHKHTNNYANGSSGHPGADVSKSQSPSGTNLLLIAAFASTALNPFNLNFPLAYDSLNTVTTNVTSLVPSGISSSICARTTLDVPVSLFVAAEFPS